MPIFKLMAGLASLFWLFQGVWVNQALAHGTGWSQTAGFSVNLSFYYSDQTPMAYSEVQIFSPADAQIPHQKARADKNGYFSFCPDSPGIWKFAASDGQGHLSAGEIAVSDERLSGAAEPASPAGGLAGGGSVAGGPDPLSIILGLSLLANLALWRMRRSQDRSAG